MFGLLGKGMLITPGECHLLKQEVKRLWKFFDRSII